MLAVSSYTNWLASRKTPAATLAKIRLLLMVSWPFWNAPLPQTPYVPPVIDRWSIVAPLDCCNSKTA